MKCKYCSLEIIKIDEHENCYKEKKIVLIIGKPISKMNESEVDEVLNELVRNGVIQKDDFGNYFKMADDELDQKDIYIKKRE